MQFNFNPWLFIGFCKWWWSPIIHIKLHNLKRCSINWIVELHNWIMEPHNLGAALSPSALHIIQQNINLTLFRKNISPRLLFLDFVFNLYLSFIFILPRLPIILNKRRIYQVPKQLSIEQYFFHLSKHTHYTLHNVRKPSDIKPLPEPMLTHVFFITCHS